ncbi:MAG: 4Fe-4S binding protein [Deltaproteobacteria bacterium]|nr:4Fe-4S binding protein [Deltaproteobacteria bacterium]
MTGPLKQIWDEVAGLWSLIVGLKVTAGYFFSKQVTVHYPRFGVDNLETFRGPIQLSPNPEDATRPLCIACMTCASTCPTGAISVVRKKTLKPQEGAVGKKAPRGPEKFTYDYTVCCQCGLCAENCPEGAIRFSGNPYSANSDKNAFIFDLLEPFGIGVKS